MLSLRSHSTVQELNSMTLKSLQFCREYGLSLRLVLVLCALSLSNAILAEPNKNTTHSITHENQVSHTDLKEPLTAITAQNDWYFIDQLTHIAPHRSSQITETMRRQTATCGGAYYEPPRYNLDLLAPATDSILGSAIQYQFEEDKLAKLIGNVVLQQAGMQVESDLVEIDFATNTAHINGNIRFRDDQMLLFGDSAELQLDSGDVHFENVEYTLHSQHIRGIAAALDSHPPDSMTIHEGTYTGCQPGNNDWYFRGEKIELNSQTGWGTAHHMALFIQHVPVFYVPYFRFPIDDKRHTGMLYPTFNSLAEPDISIPLYFNLAPHYDLTLTPRFIGDRGTLWQSEFRYLHQTLGEGQLDFAIIPEDKSFQNEPRKSARWKEKWNGRQYWSAEADINYLSDSDYLNDFGTSLSTISESHLIREVKLGYIKDHWQFSTRLQSWQTIDENVTDTDLPYRRLPEINLTHYQSLPLTETLTGARIDWRQIAQLVYFEQNLSDRSLSNPSYATRFHYQTELALPVRSIWGFIRPATTLYATQYHLNGLTNPDDQQQAEQNRHLASASIDTGLYFERIIDLEAENKMPEPLTATASNTFSLTQTLEPRLYFLYVPYKDQSDIPLLDSSDLTFGMSQLFRPNRYSGFDRIGDTQQISLAITSRFINNHSGLEMGKLSIGQIFYQKDRQVPLIEGDSDELQRTSSNIVTETEVNWNHFWSARAAFEWDAADNRIEQGQLQLNYLVNERQLYHIGYRFRQPDSLTEEKINQYDISIIHPYSNNWDIIAAWNFDLEKEQTLEQLTGLSYSSCCWRTSLLYRSLIEDTNTFTDDASTQYSLMLEFELIGLGQLGGQLQKLLQRTVFGYDQFTEQ